MRTETDTNAKKSGGRIAAENTTALTSSFGMRSTGKPGNEPMSDGEAEDTAPTSQAAPR